MKYSINDLKFGGSFHPFFWDEKTNPLATIANGLADCTTLVIGDCARDGLRPVTQFRNASQWHKYLAAGWKCIKYDASKVKVGDIIQWVNKCHVARVADIQDGKIYLHSSWYTGEHGVSVWNGEFDSRKSIKSLQQLSDFMTQNYPTRFYHFWDLETEAKGVGGMPEHILVMPNRIKTDSQDKTRNQIKVNTNEQNIRSKPNGPIVGISEIGYYNVYAQVEDNGYRWFEIKDELYIAEVKGRVEYIEAEKIDYDRIIKENADLKKRLERIKVEATYE